RLRETRDERLSPATHGHGHVAPSPFGRHFRPLPHPSVLSSPVGRALNKGGAEVKSWESRLKPIGVDYWRRAPAPRTGGIWQGSRCPRGSSRGIAWWAG